MAPPPMYLSFFNFRILPTPIRCFFIISNYSPFCKYYNKINEYFISKAFLTSSNRSKELDKNWHNFHCTSFYFFNFQVLIKTSSYASILLVLQSMYRLKFPLILISIPQFLHQLHEAKCTISFPIYLYF